MVLVQIGVLDSDPCEIYHVQGIDVKTIETDISYGEIMGKPLSSLQSVLQDLFKPWIEQNEILNKCNDSDWKEYQTRMGKFSDLVTEAVHSLDIGIELKMPDGSQYGNIPPTQTGFAKAAVDRCVMIEMDWRNPSADYLWVGARV
jgi:hypothetical protein